MTVWQVLIVAAFFTAVISTVLILILAFRHDRFLAWHRQNQAEAQRRQEVYAKRVEALILLSQGASDSARERAKLAEDKIDRVRSEVVVEIDALRKAGGLAVAFAFILFAGNLNIAAIGLTWEAPVLSMTDYHDRAMAAMSRRDYTAAAELFDDYVEAGGDAHLGLGRKAECLYYLGRYEEALAVCDHLGATVPNADTAHYIRGLVYKAQGRDCVPEFRAAAAAGNRYALLRPELRR